MCLQSSRRYQQLRPIGTETKAGLLRRVAQAAKRTCRSVSFDSSGALAGYQSGRALTHGFEYYANLKMYTDPGNTEFQFTVIRDFETLISSGVDRECSHR